MNNISTLPASEREILFRNTAEKTGLTEAIIEKDFWVCWTLDYLFHDSRWKDHLAFKGGTSLSKCYDLIHRFSEDIPADRLCGADVLGEGDDSAQGGIPHQRQGSAALFQTLL